MPARALPATAARDESAKQLKNKYYSLIQTVSVKHGVDADLVHHVIAAESNYDCWAVSEKGAMGLMQLMPETAKYYGVKNTFDPVQNIEGGVKYLKDLISLFNRQTKYVLAAYNAGQQAVKKFGGIPPYAETRNYIARIMSSYKRPFVKSGTQIYRCFDAEGKLILTNDPNFYLLHKGK